MSRISMTLDISIYFAFEKGYNYVENKQDIKTWERHDTTRHDTTLN